MMLEQLQALWNEYYPIIVTALGTISAVVGMLYLAWSKISPLLEKLKDIKEDVSSLKADDVKNSLSTIDLDTKILDLQSKIESPAISPALTEQYQVQLDKLLAIKQQIESGLVKVEEVTNKF